MHGNKKKHKEMWQYIIDHVDDIFKNYVEGSDPEDVIVDYKQYYIIRVNNNEKVSYNCYACEEFFSLGCNVCPIFKRVGCCSYNDSAFQKLLNAIRGHDRKEFIKQARRIKNAW